MNRAREQGPAQEPTTNLIHRARSEFIEMPGLQLTTRQAARLWAVDHLTSEGILEQLVASGFLGRSRDGSYLRTSQAHI